jgi:hypothetical protein
LRTAIFDSPEQLTMTPNSSPNDARECHITHDGPTNDLDWTPTGFPTPSTAAQVKPRILLLSGGRRRRCVRARRRAAAGSARRRSSAVFAGAACRRGRMCCRRARMPRSTADSPTRGRSTTGARGHAADSGARVREDEVDRRRRPTRQRRPRPVKVQDQRHSRGTQAGRRTRGPQERKTVRLIRKSIHEQAKRKCVNLSISHE